MNSTLRNALPAALVCAAMAPAHAGLLTYQGVTFNSAWAGNVLTLEIDAAGRTDAWAGAAGLVALELDGIGSYTSMGVAGAPTGAGGWTASSSELNAKGCSGRSNGQVGSRLCFYGRQIALADDMVFRFTFNGNAVRPADPQLKVAFVDSKGKKVGGLLSQTLPASPGSVIVDAGTPEIPPLADQAHREPGKPSTGSESGDGAAVAIPEPQGIAVLLAGLGLMGVGAGRRPRT